MCSSLLQEDNQKTSITKVEMVESSSHDGATNSNASNKYFKYRRSQIMVKGSILNSSIQNDASSKTKS